MPRNAPPLPRIAVIAGGGTLTALAQDPFEICDYGQAGSLDAAALIARCGPMQTRFALQPVPFTPLPSFDMGPPQWQEIRRLCAATLQAVPDLSGFVLTHGTGSLEETAFFLSCTWDLPVPLVLTGAQRPASALGSDGYMNFFQAACVAACPEARAHGVLVVTHGEIHLPAEVTKTLNFGLDTFRAPVLGPVGLVTGETVRFHRAPAAARRIWRVPADCSALPRVDIVLCHTGGDAVAIEAFLAAGARGIVVAGFAPGYATGVQAGRLERWIKEEGGLVVIASRAQGMVMPNSRNDGHGFLPAGLLSPQKARIVLQLALACGIKPPQIADVFR